MRPSPPTLSIKMRIKLMRFNYLLEFCDGFTMENYSTAEEAKKSYDFKTKAKDQFKVKQKIKLDDKTIYTYYKEQDAWKIYDDFIDGVQAQNKLLLHNPMFSFKYKEVSQ